MDDIQRKLELFDKQLAGRNLHKQIISTCPLLFIAVGLIIGILIQHAIFGSRVTSHGSQFLWFWLILLGLFTAATVLLLIIQLSSTDHQLPITNYQYVMAYLALACFACLGAIRLAGFHKPRPNDIRNFIADEPKLATIRGLITTEPYINDNRNWEFAKFKFNDPASSFYLKVSEVETVDPVRSKSPGVTAAPSIRTSNGVNGWAKATGTVRVQVSEPVLDLKAGDYIQAYCWLDKFKGPTNPGQFNISKHLARKNIFISAAVKSRDGIELPESSPAGLFTKIRRKFRETATQALVGNLSPQEPNRGLLEALLLGYRGNIDSSTYQAFRKTGLLHFISLSGMHLGILVGIIWWLCKTAGLMKPARAIICIIAIGIFLLIVPPRAPTVRAAIICLVFCISFFFRRHCNSLNTLSLAAIILLLIRPTNLFEAGWQLSFAAVLGILLFTEKIENFLHERTSNRFCNIASKDTKILMRLMKKLAGAVITLFSVGLAAWLGGAGILLYHFYTITPLASIWTILVFPLVGAILVLGFLKMILFLLLPTLGTALGVMVTVLSEWLILIVKFIASLDISEILIGAVPAAVIVFYYCLIGFAGFVYFRRPLIKKATCTAMILIIIGFLSITKWQRTYRNNLIITCLDAGHGQAILAQLPGKANVLFDAGSLHKSDIGRRIVVPFLNYSGINKIDAIIISHNDIDHINGIPEIVEHYEVSGVYANDAFFSKTDRWGTAKFLKESLRKKGHKIHLLGENLNLDSGAGIKILWPSKQICANDELGDNDKSVVSLIEFAGRRILLCSDIEKFAQGELLRLFSNLKAEVIVVPHHGSARTLDDDFLENLDADVLICSCGRSQYEKQQVLKPTNEAKLFYTPKDGAVTVRIDKDGTIRTETFGKQKW